MTRNVKSRRPSVTHVSVINQKPRMWGSGMGDLLKFPQRLPEQAEQPPEGDMQAEPVEDIGDLTDEEFRTILRATTRIYHKAMLEVVSDPHHEE